MRWLNNITNSMDMVKTIKKAEHQRINAFKLWCWKRLSGVPWTARRSNQSILKEINPEYSLEGLMLKLKLQYFGHLMQTVDSLENTLMLGKTKGKRRRGQQRMMVGWHHWLNGHKFEQALEDSEGQIQTQLTDWITTRGIISKIQKLGNSSGQMTQFL